MKIIERLVRIACHYNKIKFAEFFRDYKHARVTDCKSMVFYYVNKVMHISAFEISELINRDEDYVLKHIERHDQEYTIINHYKKTYENIVTQYENWQNSNLDLAYSITKTQYDTKTEIKYEMILTENNRLKHEIDILKLKLNKKNYV
tara:strand:- start:3349 stop:3789 length:441 start_codon:yes stop_codon:yes gene_type:complete